MSAPVDQAARDRITTTGLRETLFVDAGAGTGKTSTLVDRIVHLVQHEQVSLRDLAAITFSEAAAAELRDRVRRALDNGARADDAVAAERCADALADFDTAAISTLHGFAHRLLREHPIEVAIPPRVEVLDEVQSILAFEDRWDAHVDRWQNDERYVPLVVRLWSCGIELRRAFGPSLKDVAAVLDDNWDRLEEFTPAPMRLPRALDRRPLLAAIDDALVLGEECLDPDDKLLFHLATLLPEWRAVQNLDPLDDDRLVALLRKRSKWSPGRKGTKKTWPDIESARACVAAVDDAAASLCTEAVDDVLSIWLGVLHEVTLAAAHERRDAGQLEFHDLLVLARRLLRTSPAARRDVHQRYTRVLLDEFQDTDPIQIELALRIAADPTHDAADWRDLELPPGRLFFVGDPKQSIYRFRRADIALFHETRDLVGAGAQVSLVQNFRTVEPILAWVNAVFDALMPEESPSQPRYSPLSAMRGPSKLADHRVVLFGAAHPDDPPAAELRRREAADVAAIVDAIRADPSSRPVWGRADDGTESWRPARCSDITVLIPSRASLPMLEGALVAADVPYRVDTTTLVFESPAIRDLLAVLMAIDDPADAVSVVAALRSPVLACSDPDLLDWVQAGGTFDYRGAGSPADVPGAVAVGARSGAVAEAMAALSAWHDAARWCEPATLLERIVRERDVFALALTDRRPRDVWRRVRFLIDQARQFADVGGGHLRAFVRWADLQRREGSRVPEPLLPETDDDAVRIMTFHGAKGLEFPIVVLSGLTTRPGGARGGPQVNWHADGRPEISLGAGKATGHFEVLNEFESEMDVDEKLRLLYVGVTRARDHLFVSTHRRAKDDGSNLTYGARVQTVSAAHANGRFVTMPAEAEAAVSSSVPAAVPAAMPGETARSG
ncbi:MAG: AAA family ATPase, partial [Actinobacteria bacterium]|nr:AAA family ATPase [Actinomycetota bacterium]